MWAFVKLVGWGLLLLIIWPYIEVKRRLMKKPRIDNCVTWAVRKWEERPTDSYLVIRWCRSSRTDMKWPHFMWLEYDENIKFKHFVPKTDDQETKFIPDAFFEGKVITGDNPDDDVIEN